MFLAKRSDHGKAVDLLRRIKRQQASSLEALPVEPMDAKAAKRAAVKEELDWLADALAELEAERPEDCRLLCAHYLEGRELQDLADETGRTVHAVRNRIFRTLATLRRRARGCGPDDKPKGIRGSRKKK